MRTVIQRDVRDIADVQRATDLARLLRLIAARTGTPSNVADVARDAGLLPRSTAAVYLQLLGWVFLVESLPAWSTILSSKITKHPKLYASDSGLAAWLMGATVESLPGVVAPALGPTIETFAVLEILKQRAPTPAVVDIGHLRDRDGWDVDRARDRRPPHRRRRDQGHLRPDPSRPGRPCEAPRPPRRPRRERRPPPPGPTTCSPSATASPRCRCRRCGRGN